MHLVSDELQLHRYKPRDVRQSDSVRGACVCFLAVTELFILHDIYSVCVCVCICAGVDVIITTHGSSIAVCESGVMLTFPVKYKPRR